MKKLSNDFQPFRISPPHPKTSSQYPLFKIWIMVTRWPTSLHFLCSRCVLGHLETQKWGLLWQQNDKTSHWYHVIHLCAHVFLGRIVWGGYARKDSRGREDPGLLPLRTCFGSPSQCSGLSCSATVLTGISVLQWKWGISSTQKKTLFKDEVANMQMPSQWQHMRWMISD